MNTAGFKIKEMKAILTAYPKNQRPFNQWVGEIYRHKIGAAKAASIAQNELDKRKLNSI